MSFDEEIGPIPTEVFPMEEAPPEATPVEIPEVASAVPGMPDTAIGAPEFDSAASEVSPSFSVSTTDELDKMHEEAKAAASAEAEAAHRQALTKSYKQWMQSAYKAPISQTQVPPGHAQAQRQAEVKAQRPKTTGADFTPPPGSIPAPAAPSRPGQKLDFLRPAPKTPSSTQQLPTPMYEQESKQGAARAKVSARGTTSSKMYDREGKEGAAKADAVAKRKVAESASHVPMYEQESKQGAAKAKVAARGTTSSKMYDREGKEGAAKASSVAKTKNAESAGKAGSSGISSVKNSGKEKRRRLQGK